MVEAPLPGSFARVATASIGAALAGIAGWLVLRNLRLSGGDGWMFWVPLTLWLITMTVLCWLSALSGGRSTRHDIRGIWRGGWIVGGVGLAVGFVGPLGIYPNAKLGPLLG